MRRDSSVLLIGFAAVSTAVVCAWWPLAERVLAATARRGAWWLAADWLLLGLFAFMAATMVLGADLRRDALIVLVGAAGGLVIETWGTRTGLWRYYTGERPPPWIIPAWPIASLSIDRIARFGDRLARRVDRPRAVAALYWAAMTTFLALMVIFVWPRIGRIETLPALAACAALVVLPADRRYALSTFVAGVALGYFLEVWGTTRRCWMYYTGQTPPLFAVLAHGMAAVAFWRTGAWVKWAMPRLGYGGFAAPGSTSLPGGDPDVGP